jgi:hypothetical protein
MKTSLYREEDIEAVSSKIKDIMKIADRKSKDTLEPTYQEYLTVFKNVSDYIKKNNRIVYGGIALNEMLKDKSPKDIIYDDYSKNDIEIYSPDPIGDVIKLCDMLNEKKYKFVEGKEADHPGTFTIFVNFEKYVDITYVPKIIYNNLPYINVNGYKLIHPVYIITDTLRVYTDPLTSYFRLEKTFDRVNRLLKVANFKPEKGVVNQPKPSDSIKFIMNSIIPKLSMIKNIIFTDDIAYNYYMNQDITEITHIGVIVQKVKNNAQLIFNILLDAIAHQDVNYKEKIKIDEYNTFFQFWDHRIVIYYNKVPILTIYENKEKCLPFKNLEFNSTKINIANFTLTILYYLIHYNYDGIFKLNYKEYEHRIGNLLDSKNTYLTKNKKTVLDDTKYNEFQIECLGATVEFKYKNRLKFAARKEKGGILVYRYDPSNKQRSTISTEFKFPNEAGTLITNDNLKFISNH